jgi:hypothetical protein
MGFGAIKSWVTDKGRRAAGAIKDYTSSATEVVSKHGPAAIKGIELASGVAKHFIPGASVIHDVAKYTGERIEKHKEQQKAVEEMKEDASKQVVSSPGGDLRIINPRGSKRTVYTDRFNFGNIGIVPISRENYRNEVSRGYAARDEAKSIIRRSKKIKRRR